MKVPTQKFKPTPLHPKWLHWCQCQSIQRLWHQHDNKTAFQQRFLLSVHQKLIFTPAPNIMKKYLKSILEGGAWWQKAFFKK